MCRSRAVQPCGYLAVISLCWLSAKLEFSTVITHARNEVGKFAEAHAHNDLTKPPFYAFPIFRIFHGFVTAFSRCSLVVRCLFYMRYFCYLFGSSSGVKCLFLLCRKFRISHRFVTASLYFCGVIHTHVYEGAKFPFMGVAFVAISPSSLRVQHGCNLNRFVTASGVNRALNTQAQRSTHEAANFNCWACVSAALKYVGC